jgi:DNA-binding CsgD family transcriptional regulator
MSVFAFNQFCALRKPTSSHRSVALTGREREVVKWVSAGKTDAAIGTILHINERTVRAHMYSAARKLNAANRPAAVAEALRIRAIPLNH